MKTYTSKVYSQLEMVEDVVGLLYFYYLDIPNMHKLIFSRYPSSMNLVYIPTIRAHYGDPPCSKINVVSHLTNRELFFLHFLNICLLRLTTMIPIFATKYMKEQSYEEWMEEIRNEYKNSKDKMTWVNLGLPSPPSTKGKKLHESRTIRGKGGKPISPQEKHRVNEDHFDELLDEIRKTYKGQRSLKGKKKQKALIELFKRNYWYHNRLLGNREVMTVEELLASMPEKVYDHTFMLREDGKVWLIPHWVFYNLRKQENSRRVIRNNDSRSNWYYADTIDSWWSQVVDSARKNLVG